MTNPRKFADKLEIIRRKEEEANAAFDKIMREVSDARSGQPGTSPHHPHHTPWFRGQNDMRIRQKYKGGSLPNVNIAPNTIPVESALFGEMYGHPHTYSLGMNYLRRPGEPPSGPIFPSKAKPRSYTVTAPYRNNLMQQPTNPMIAEQQNDSNSSMWRRTYSDSAIQHSLQQVPQKKIEGSPLAQTSNGPRIIQTPTQPMKNNEIQQQNFSSPPAIHFTNDGSHQPQQQPPKSHMQMQANTNSLPDLSNLSIPSPIQNPIDNESGGNDKNVSPGQQEMPNPFQSPFRVPRRVIGRQVYSRPNNNEFSNMVVEKNEMNQPNSALNNNIVNHGAPLSPVTPPPYFWNTTPMSPLATTDDIMAVNNGATDLQQQLQQFQMQNDNANAMPPPAYPFMNEAENFANMYPPSNVYNKQQLVRIHSGPPNINSMMMNNKDFKSNQLCDRQLDSALAKFKPQNYSNNTEISEEDLNSVRLALNPLDFDDVSILNDNSDLVDQNTEEQFRLERASGY